jgi:hypothetical protein
MSSEEEFSGQESFEDDSSVPAESFEDEDMDSNQDDLMDEEESSEEPVMKKKKGAAPDQKPAKASKVLKQCEISRFVLPSLSLVKFGP